MIRRSAAALTIACFVSGATLLQCSVITSFDDLQTLAVIDAAPMEGSAIEAGAVDASDSSSPIDAGIDASTTPPNIAVVQRAMIMGASSFVFPAPTTAGNLLVGMEPVSGVRPNGSGWQAVPSSDKADVIYLWFNNPGGLKTFNGPNNADMILLEFSGIAANATVDFESDTGGRGPNITMLSLTGHAPAAAGELILLYMDSTSATPNTLDGWTSLGTDSNNNFGWWLVGDSGEPSATLTFSPSSPTALLMVAITRSI